MSIALKEDQVRLLRLQAQHLLPGQVEKRLMPSKLMKEIFALQAQDLSSAMLSLWARDNYLQAEDIRAAMYLERSIVRAWSLRGTLHLVTREDAAWLVPLLGSRFIETDRRRFTQLGWDEERYIRGLQMLVGVLRERGSLLRSEIIDLLQSNDLPSKGQAPVHFLYRAALEGVICEGPERHGKPAFTLFEDWIGEPTRKDRRDALRKLVRCYLNAHGPASIEDMASWSGLKISAIREAWEDLGDGILGVDINGKPAFICEEHLSRLDEALDEGQGVILLPRFDTLLLSYTDRNWVVETKYDKYIRPGGGIIAATVLVDGKVQGTWSTQRKKRNLEVLVRFFHDQPARVEGETRRQVSSLGRFFQVEAVTKMIKSA